MIVNKCHDWTFVPTIFPDGTSQMWKQAEFTPMDLWWTFESEAEIMHLLQLFDLYTETFDEYIKYIVIPFFPYSRQDKRVSNTTTFALHTFMKIVHAFFPRRIYTVDMHGNYRDPQIRNIPPDVFVIKSFQMSGADCIVFPDTGAYERASMDILRHPYVMLQKDRDPETGKINFVRCLEDLTGKTVLLIDDICDGGATFIRAAAACYTAGASDVQLYVTHGLFTKGISNLREAGISRILSTNSVLNGSLADHVFSVEEIVEPEVTHDYW